MLGAVAKIATPKAIVIVIAIVIILLIISFYLTYRSGKSSGTESSTVKPPKAITGELPQETVEDLDGLAHNLYNDMDGVNIMYDDDLYNRVKLLSDTELVVLSNIFNNAYQEGSETFIIWLDSQWFWNYSASLQTTVNDIIDRLQNLNVS